MSPLHALVLEALHAEPAQPAPPPRPDVSSWSPMPWHADAKRAGARPPPPTFELLLTEPATP